MFPVVTLQQPRIIPQSLWYRHKGDPIHQPVPKLPQGGIEPDRGYKRHAVARPEVHNLRHSQNGIDIPRVGDRNAFRHTGRARRVDDVGDISGGTLHVRTPVGRRTLLDPDHGADRINQSSRRRKPVKHNEDFRTGVSGHRGQPRRRKFVIERQVGPACFPYPQDGCGKVG